MNSFNIFKVINVDGKLVPFYCKSTNMLINLIKIIYDKKNKLVIL
jgi:hypothetical protein